MPASRDEVTANLRAIREAIRSAAERAGRDPAAVELVAAAKTVPPERAPATADLVTALEGVRLRGLMTIPPLTPTAEEARPWFVRLRELRDRIRRTYPDVLELSMGMSLDYQVAIEEGATMVRIGTALFGPRATTGTRERPAP